MGTTTAELKTDYEKIDQLKKEVEYLKGVTLIAIEKFEKDLETVEIQADESSGPVQPELKAINILSPELDPIARPPLKDSIKQIK